MTPRWVLLAAVTALAGCGGGLGTQPPDPSAATSSPEGPPAATEAPDSPMTVTRSGGIAGLHDVVEIAADGSARVTRRDGAVSACTPSPEAVARLRAIDLRAIGTPAPKPPIADAFSYTITTAGTTVMVEEGDVGAGRTELLAAASEVVSSCLASTSGSGTYQ
ncbi:MAG TPA: hypothetical protein VFP56_01615 [Candidatus Limnocylindrales bacterium]|nr:hypothetical protein [Candidatus Limnocylindrales bacterium]